MANAILDRSLLISLCMSTDRQDSELFWHLIMSNYENVYYEYIPLSAFEIYLQSHMNISNKLIQIPREYSIKLHGKQEEDLLVNTLHEACNTPNIIRAYQRYKNYSSGFIRSLEETMQYIIRLILLSRDFSADLVLWQNRTELVMEFFTSAMVQQFRTTLGDKAQRVAYSGNEFPYLPRQTESTGTTVYQLVILPEQKDNSVQQAYIQKRLASKIFVNYRRDDSADICGRIYDSLVAIYSRDSVFKDVDSVPIGVNFKEYIAGNISKSGVILVVIGTSWAEKPNLQRLWSPDDYVRMEIELAIEKQIPIIPVLVQNAKIPSPEKLPSSLAPLQFQNAIYIRPDPDFHADVAKLMRGIEFHIQVVYP